MRTLLGIVITLLVTAATPQAAERATIAGVLHVHSTWSTGALSLDELADFARTNRLGAVLLSENYLLRVEYGLPPFRALTRVTYTGGKDLLDAGIGRYLDAVADAQRRHPHVVFVPGVEVMPHYRWSGAPLALDLLLEDTQKNMLVFGLNDRAALATLPAVGHRIAGRYGWQSLLDALPVAIVVPGLVLILRKQTRRVRVGVAGYALIRRRRWWLGGMLVAIGVAAFVRAWPFAVDRYPSWSQPGIAPYQDFIDHVERAGGAAIWSFPEARDEGQRHVGPVLVRHRTRPYPDDLLRTVRYTAYGAIYEDTTTFERPGGGWDRLLVQYLAGERSRPVWAVGEAGYHDPSAGKRLGLVQTVFLDAERSEAGVLDALRRGRMYALRRTTAVGLELNEFSVTAGRQSATTAETLRTTRGSDLTIQVRVTASDGGRHPVRVSLVRNGEVIAAWNGTTPFHATHRDAFAGARAAYRIDVRGDRPQQLLTNPIFVNAS